MKHLYLFLVLAIIFVVTAQGRVFAASPFVNASLETPGTTKDLVLPPAADNSPVISLGQALDPQTGEIVQGYAIVHYKDKVQQVKNNPARAGKNQCYGYLASGAKWKTVEDWVVNGNNSQGINPADIFTNVSSDILKWEDAADGTIGGGVGVNILGNGSLTTSPLVADSVSPDGVNEVYFGSVADPGAIAVTTVWGIFSGPAPNRRLVEWDQVYDQVDFGWSMAGDPSKMDFENIATHELGHSLGMADLYNSSCGDETMYGYATEGQTLKRTLNAGDITGVNLLY